MNEITEEKFRAGLLKDIDRLCSVSPNNLSCDEEKFNQVFEYYKHYRDTIHKRIKQGSMEYAEEYKENIRMDRHKIAAAFFCAIIKANPIQKTQSALKFFERTVNIQLALVFSVCFIIDTFNVSNKDNSEKDKNIFSRSFKLPSCKQSKSKEYITNFIMLIEDININNLDLDSNAFKSEYIFIISHLFFLLDMYSYQENYRITVESELLQK